MPKYSQANRLQSVTTPLGTDVLLLERFSGEEAISKLFRFELELLAESTSTVTFDQILGQGVTVTWSSCPTERRRYFNGIVSRFSQGDQIPSAHEGENTFTRYRAEVVPQLWFLTRNHQSRIFQQIAVPDILKQVLAGVQRSSNQLQGTLRPARLLRPVPRDRLRLRQPADGGGGDLLLLHARRRLLTRWWWPTRRRASPTCPARPP